MTDIKFNIKCKRFLSDLRVERIAEVEKMNKIGFFFVSNTPRFFDNTK